LQLAAAIYAMDWKDQILGASFDWEGAPVDPVTGTCTDEAGMPIPDCWNDGSFDPNSVIYQDTDAQSGMVFINRGDGELKGIELEATWRATDNLNVRGTLTLMDNIYARNCDQEPVDDMGFAPTATIADDGVPFDCYDVSGNKIEQAADQHYSLSGTYRAPLGGGGWEWMGRLGVRHEGPQFIELANLTELPGITTATGSVGFYNDNWQIILFGNNLTDEDAPRELRGLRNDREIGGRMPRNYNYLQRIPRELGVRVDFSF
jgi:outer membrane receptor protein involved in Fe transport